MPYQWSVRLAIEGDLRFLSHRDTMRAMERISSRAKLPLRYSQGFNPRPVLSLPSARPVGVASLDDRLVLTLESTIDEAELLCRLNSQAPAGLRFQAARQLPPGRTPRPGRIAHELALEAAEERNLNARLAELARQKAWPLRRAVKFKPGRDPRECQYRTIDIKPMLAELDVRDGVLRFVCVPCDQRWARPAEVLQLLGLDRPGRLADVVRTKIEDDMEK